MTARRTMPANPRLSWPWPRLLIICLFALTPVALGEEALEIRVEPDLAVSVQGYTEVQPIFGATVNGGSWGRAVEQVKALNLNSARAYLWSPQWWHEAPDRFVELPRTPGDIAQHGLREGESPPTRQETAARWERFYSQDFAPLLKQWFRDLHGRGNAQTRQLGYFSLWGLTDNLIFSRNVDGMALDNPEGVKRFYDAYIEMIKWANPELSVDFVQPHNEPNYRSWLWAFDSEAEAALAYVDLFNVLDPYIRKEHPGTKMLGPCVASSEVCSWSGWDIWFKPMIEGTEIPIEEINYHNYHHGAYDHLAWMQMIQAHAEAIGRPRPRSVVTEMNYDASSSNHVHRAHWWAQQFFTAFEHPDKHAMFNYFLLAFDGRWNHANLLRAAGEGFEPTPAYWLWWTLAWTRGESRYVEPIDLGDFMAFASMPEADQLVISIFNDSDAARRVRLRTGLSTGDIARIDHRHVAFEADKAEHGQRTIDPTPSPTLTVPPMGVQSVRFNLRRDRNATDSLAVEEFYSPTTAAEFEDDLAVGIPVARAPTPSETVTLRVGIYSDDVLFARGLTAVLNGQRHELEWDQAPPQREAEGRQRTFWWMEVPVSRESIRRDNELVLAEPDTNYRLLFASLAYREHPDPRTALRIEGDRLDAASQGILATLSPIGVFSADAEARWEFSVVNNTGGEARYAVEMKVDDGFALTTGESTGFLLADGERKTISGRLGVTDPDRVARGQLSATVEVDDTRRTLTSTAIAYPPLTASRFDDAPSIDGRIDDWSNTKAFRLDHDAMSTRTRLGWDDTHLYVAVTAETGERPRAADPATFWVPDCVEVFVDLGNEKSLDYDENDLQVYLCPLSDAGRAFAGYVHRERRGDWVEKLGQPVSEAIDIASSLRPDGYTIEAAIPWSLVDASFSPSDGKTVGLDVAVNHDPTEPDGGVVSALGLERKWHGEPRKWGVVELD